MGQATVEPASGPGVLLPVLPGGERPYRGGNGGAGQAGSPGVMAISLRYRVRGSAGVCRPGRSLPSFTPPGPLQYPFHGARGEPSFLADDLPGRYPAGMRREEVTFSKQIEPSFGKVIQPEREGWCPGRWPARDRAYQEEPLVAGPDDHDRPDLPGRPSPHPDRDKQHIAGVVRAHGDFERKVRALVT